MNASHFNHRSAGAARGIMVVLGLWLIVSPFVLGPVRGSIEWNNIAVGLVAILTAMGTGRFGGGLRGLEVLLGAWLFASPFVLNALHTSFLWNNLLMAFSMIITALVGEAVAAPDAEYVSRF